MKKKHNPSRKWIWILLIVFALLTLNECFYLAYTQFRCTRKINRGERPNLYELASAWQMHSSLWMFGWVVDANTAWACFNKQFHLESFILRPDVPQDETVRRAKAQLLIFVPISQTVLDYMERTHILSVYTETRYERIEK